MTKELKEAPELIKVDWGNMFKLEKILIKEDPNHEFVLSLSDIGWIIHEVRTMRNYVTSFRYMHRIVDTGEVLREDRKTLDPENRIDRMTNEVCVLNNRVENFTYKVLLRMYDKYKHKLEE